MTLIAAAPANVRTTPPTDPQPLPTISAGDWWPAINLADMRDAVRLDGTITPPRLIHAAQEALAATIGQLATWADRRQLEGHASLADVPADKINGTSIKVLRFQRAVYSHAKANLLERYADYDTNNRERHVNYDLARERQAEEHRRDATWAVRDILDAQRLHVDLI